MALEPKRFLIAGGAGFLGSNLCKRLWQKGHSVVCWDKYFCNPPELDGQKNFEWAERDVTQYTHCVIGSPVDYVLHFGSPVSPRDFMKDPMGTLKANSEGTENLLTLAAKRRSRFFFPSTARIYRGEDPTGPRAVYEQAKRYGEALVACWQRSGLVEARIARMWQTYGPGCRLDDGHVIPTFIRQALKGEDIRVMGGNQIAMFTYVDDMLDGIERVLFSDEKQPVDLGSLEQVSIEYLAREIIQLCGSKSKMTNTWEKISGERVPDLIRARYLGWEAKVPLEEGLKRTIEYFRKVI